jgi:hypothetical protein
VGHHQDSQTQTVGKPLHQLVVVRRADWVETGRRLVEKKEFGIERERARQARPFAHATGKFRGLLLTGIRWQADHRDLQRRDLAHRLFFEFGVLADGDNDVLGDAQGGEQRAVLKLDTRARQHLALSLAVKRAGVDPEHLDRAFTRLVQTDDSPEENRFPSARPAY